MFSWFSKKPDPIFQQAETLVSAANILGISSYTKFADDLPIVNSIETEHWDWVFTIAGVFVALTRLNAMNLESNTKEKVLEIVGHKLGDWKPDGLAGFEDCKTFFDRTYDNLAKMDHYRSDNRFLASDSLGGWMTWNLLGHAPESEDERGLIRTTGSFVTHSFFGWWEKS
ncbi:MAG: hypothetical protein KF747_05420 [Nitrospira sp.]|nr:hypothetical protein [Nitrospira sp.]